MLRDDYKRNPLTWFQDPKVRKKDRREQEILILDDPNEDKPAKKSHTQQTQQERKMKPSKCQKQDSEQQEGFEYYKDPEDQSYQYCFPPPELVDQLKEKKEFFSQKPVRMRRSRKSTKKPLQQQEQMTIQNCYNSILVQQQLAEEKNRHKNDLTLENILDNLESGTPIKYMEHKERMEKNFQIQKNFQEKLSQYKETRKFNLNLKEKHVSYCFPFKPSFTIPMREVSMLDQYYDDDDEDRDIYTNIPKRFRKPIEKERVIDKQIVRKNMANKKAQGQEWKCMSCGYVNSGFQRNCEICSATQFY